MGASGIIATLLSLILVIVSLWRQNLLAYDRALISVSSVTAKQQICVVLFLNAQALMTHSVVMVLWNS